MKKIIGIFLLTCACNFLHAQVNYVLNPSFEDHAQCPYSVDQIKFANYWTPIDSLGTYPFLPYCSAEYLNVCGSGYGSVPNNGYYYHFPRTGNAMIEMIMYVNENQVITSNRDYSQGRFYATLLPNKSYCVTFYVALEQSSGYANNHIGAYIDNGSIDIAQDSVGCSNAQTAYVPQVYTNTIINDTLNWTKIEGSFTANGTEKFITIGNFYDMLHTDTLYRGGNYYFSLYLVDDVSVIPSDLQVFAGHDTTITIGDSVFLGRHDLMPDMKWYVLGSSTVIDSSAGFGRSLPLPPAMWCSKHFAV